MLSDSKADISAAKQALTGILEQQVDNLMPSEISSRAVNGVSMKSLGKIPVAISLQGRKGLHAGMIFTFYQEYHARLSHGRLPEGWAYYPLNTHILSETHKWGGNQG